MTDPKAAGERFLALSGGTMSLLEIVKMVKSRMPEAAKNASTQPMPDWLIKTAALFNKQARSIAPLVGIYRNASNEKARSLLGWKPRTNEEAIMASVESMVRYGALKAG
jgi:dihydroflavonol-4-reductase